MKKKIVAIILVVLLIEFSFINVFASSKTQIQNGINDKREELQTVQSAKSQALQEIDNLNTSIAELEKEIADLNSKIEELTKNISIKEKEIKEKERELKEKDKLLKDRLVALYEAGETTFLDLLLSSASITDFISNYYLIQQITECDTDVMNSIEDAKTQIENAKKDLENKKQELDTAKNEVTLKNNKLIEDKNAKQAKVNSLTEEEKEIEGQLAAYNAQMAQIEAQERKAAEEARKRAEEEAKKKNETNKNQASFSGSSIVSGGSSSTVTSSGKMAWPIPGYNTITSYFGYRIHPIYGTWKLHSGIDVGAPKNARFVAADDGVVLIASWGYNGGYGNYVVIDHGNGITTRYAHGTSILVTKGQRVTKGTPVLTVGSTGASTGNHAHFEVRVNGTAVNPLNYI